MPPGKKSTKSARNRGVRLQGPLDRRRGARRDRRRRRRATSRPAWNRSKPCRGVEKRRAHFRALQIRQQANSARTHPDHASAASKSAATNSSSWPARARSKAKSRLWKPPKSWPQPAPKCCAAARSSRAPRPTISRAWKRKASSCCDKARARHRPRHHHRSDERPRRRSGRRIRRHHADRRAQHAELRAAQSARQMRPPGPAEARPELHHQGTADVGRIHRRPRQSAT